MQPSELLALLDHKCSIRVPGPRTFRSIGSIGVAFPQALPPGINQYRLESGIGRDTVGIAISGLEIDAMVVYARIGKGLLKSTRSKHNLGDIRVELDGEQIMVCEEVERRKAFAVKHDGVFCGTLRITDHFCLWMPNDGCGNREFKLASIRSLEEVAGGLFRGFTQPFSQQKPLSDDLICDFQVQYGARAEGLMGVLLFLRMVIFPYDFSPTS